MEETKGITADKEKDFSEWYTQVVNKAELIEYTDVSGCLILRPYAFAMWERIVVYMDKLFKDRDVSNGYFPVLIPQRHLMKEADHVEGFIPEVAWVTETGDTKLNEKLAVRPTSETVMYPAYSKWIRSHRDLPLKINQWNNVVRWEFKHPMPFLRTREFLWQEGHTVFATKEEAEEEVMDILNNVYHSTCEELLAIPTLLGRKSEKEKFAGGFYTTSGEVVLPNGKAIQGFTSHCLGQNFAKAFDITYTDENKEKQYCWQNCWGFTTRTLGIMIILHGDNKGLVLPPRIAPQQVVIVPILFQDSKEKVLEIGDEIKSKLNARVKLDDREGYTPGYKFNEWEMKGVPLRIELGPKDVRENQAVVVRRDTGEKNFVSLDELSEFVDKQLEEMHHSMLDRAKELMNSKVEEVETLDELNRVVADKKIAYAPFCGGVECEEELKDKADGAKTLTSPFEQPDMSGKVCVGCGKPAERMFYIGKSY